MKRVSSLAVALALGGCLATVGSDGQVMGGEAGFRLSLPVLLPPLVVVQPGLSVVRDLDEEVFWADGYYWARQDQSWYRTRDHRQGWTRVEQRHVPAAAAQAPPGRYRRYRGEAQAPERSGHGHGQDEDERERGKHDRRDDDRR